MKPNDPWDQRFALYLQAGARPTAPASVSERTRSLLRRRRLLHRVSMLATAAAVLLGVGVTLRFFRSDPQPQPPTPVADLRVLDGLTPPPVDPLEVLDRQQHALLVALKQGF